MTTEEQTPVTDVTFFRFNYSVDFLVSVDGKPSRVISTPPSAVMAADFDAHEMNIPDLLRQAQAQVAGSNGQGTVG